MAVVRTISSRLIRAMARTTDRLGLAGGVRETGLDQLDRFRTSIEARRGPYIEKVN